MRQLLQILLLSVLIPLQVPGFGQAHAPYSKHNLMMELKVQYGFLVSHHLELDIFQSHFPAVELSIQKATWGAQQWETVYGYPLIGFSLWYSPLGGFKQIGFAVAAFPFINFPIIRNDKQSLNFRLGAGVGYLSNHYDNIINYQNFAIGSNFNVAGSLYFEYRREISDMITISGGIGLTHFSNGSMKTPNYGLNLMTATLGFSSYLRRPNPRLNKKLLPELVPYEFDGKKHLDFDVAVFLGYKDMSQQFGKRFMVVAVSANLLKKVSWKSKFGVGIDLTYDASDKFLLEWSGQPAENEWQILKPGINAAYQLVMSRLSFIFNFGFYLAGAEKAEGDVYQRLAMRYQFAEHLFANIAVSTNWGKAEYIGFGVGYNLNFIYKRKIKH